MIKRLINYLSQCDEPAKMISEKYGVKRGGGDYQYVMV